MTRGILILLLALAPSAARGSELVLRAPLLVADDSGMRYFGRSVAILDDSQIVVGQDGIALSGRAYVVRYTNDVWVRDLLVPTETNASKEDFGFAVATSTAGEIAVGAPTESENNGAVYVFTWVDMTWESDLVPGDVNAGNLGSSVVFMPGTPDPPDVVLAGDDLQSEGAIKSGAVTVLAGGYKLWTQVGKAHKPPDLPEYAGFGGSIATDGTIAVIGAWLEDNGRGAVYTVTLDGVLNDWERLAPLDLPPGCQFGKAVAIHPDWVLVGAPASGSTGAIFAYSRADQTWTTLDTNLPGATNVGAALALDGDRLVIGDPSFATFGAVLVAREAGGAWEVDGPFQAPDPQMFGRFGAAVAIRGTRVVVGEPERSAKNGAIYDFDLVGSVGDPCALDGDCANGTCSDGVCCDADCGDSEVDCQKCSPDGKCQPLIGDACTEGPGCNMEVCEDPSGASSDGTGVETSGSGTNGGTQTGETAGETSSTSEPTSGTTEPTGGASSPGASGAGAGQTPWEFEPCQCTSVDPLRGVHQTGWFVWVALAWPRRRRRP